MRRQSREYPLDYSHSSIPVDIHWIACMAPFQCISTGSLARRAGAMQVIQHTSARRHTHPIVARARTRRRRITLRARTPCTAPCERMRCIAPRMWAQFQ
jgi:hypothetical protein